ncbi:MAG: 16S rRNA (cytosine(1402)-N(4))-methyltransferase RsmH [Bacteroidota bacterium]|nr:16S rRNA (cytosine(1402)-N(4))-methyltransferase RsmH [Bacteroidota bacterium]
MEINSGKSVYHTPVLLHESVEGLSIKPDGIYVDLTFGGGGHSKEILKHLTTGHLFAFDQDEDAVANAENLDKSSFTLISANFRYLKKYLKLNGITKVDGLLADLGVSSHQFDTAHRGFSFRFDGPLDMRMNQLQPNSAIDIINKYEVADLHKIFGMYGEINNAKTLAEVIHQQRSVDKIVTTTQLKNIAWKMTKRGQENKYLAQLFQALRIEVNEELKALEEVLLQSPEVIKKGGRLSVITYHSLEDRLVKNFIRSGKFYGEAEKDVFGNSNVPFVSINKKIIEPTDSEIQINPRARSAKLRIAEKT